MTIKADGERSRRRLPVAKKALASISDMGIPAKASMFEGFTYKVWQMGEISGGQITSPPGIAVTLSYPDGTRQYICDSFETVGAGAEANRWLLAPSPLPAVEDGPQFLVNTSGLGVVEASSAGAVWGRVVPFPILGDVLAFCADYRPGDAPNEYHVTSMQINGCYSLGGSDTSVTYAPGFTLAHKHYESLLANATEFSRAFKLGTTYVGGGYFESVSSKRLGMFEALRSDASKDWVLGVYNYYHAPTDSYGNSVMALRNTVADVPQPILDAWSYWTPTLAGAHHARIGNDVQGVNVIVTTVDLYGLTTDEAPWELIVALNSLADPASNKAVKLLEIGAVLEPFIYGTGALVAQMHLYRDASYDGTKPDTSTAAGLKEYSDDVKVGMQLLLGWPINLGEGYGAGAAFFDGSGNAYLVRHRYLTSVIGFKFDRAAGTFATETLTPPQQIIDDIGVDAFTFRITQLSAGVYLCEVNAADGSIAGLHIGSPLTGTWSAVTLPIGAALRVVRPMVFATGQIGFVAVGRDAAATTYPFRVYLMLPGAAWAALGPVALAETAYSDDLLRWGVTVFGDNAMAVATNNVIQYPTTA